MNITQFTAALSMAGDTTENIRRYRKIVVGLAVTGKFGMGKKMSPASYPSVPVEHLLPAFDPLCAFTRVDAVARIEKGKTGIKQAVPGAYPMVVTGEERGTCDHFDFDGSAAIVPLVSSAGHGKASLNRLHYQEGKFALGTILAAIFPTKPEAISARFIFEYLSAFKDELLVSRMIGTANVSLSIGKIAEVPIPLLCRDVQQKIERLVSLCDQLEAAAVRREAVRSRLLDALLQESLAPSGLN